MRMCTFIIKYDCDEFCVTIIDHRRNKMTHENGKGEFLYIAPYPALMTANSALHCIFPDRPLKSNSIST